MELQVERTWFQTTSARNLHFQRFGFAWEKSAEYSDTDATSNGLPAAEADPASLQITEEVPVAKRSVGKYATRFDPVVNKTICVVINRLHRASTPVVLEDSRQTLNKHFWAASTNWQVEWVKQDWGSWW